MRGTDKDEPMLKFEEKIITRKEGDMLSMAAEIKELHEWQRKKLQMSRCEYAKIDWEAQHTALAKLPQNMHRFAVRFVYHWLPPGKRIKMNNQLDEDKCPLCGKADEASSHFFPCRHKARQKSFRDII